jgi:1-acylglycerone phosphate reductase
VYEAPAIEADPVRIRGMFNTNVFGLFDMVSAFTPLLLNSTISSATPPVIINTSSILARLPFAFSAAYNASKAAVASYSDTLRIELGPLGIKVVTLFMGEVSTNLMSPDNISFDPESIYSVALEGTKERSRNHARDSMRPEVFAKQFVQAILAQQSEYGKGDILWKGSNAWVIWLLNLVGWRYILDNVAKKMIGLENKEVRKSILDKARKLWTKETVQGNQ